MTSPVRDQGGISEMRQRPARTALALAIACMSLVVAAQSLRAQTLSVLYSFTGKDGDDSPGELVRDSAGNFCGKTTYDRGDGTVLKLYLGKNGAWTERVLHIFEGPPDDGATPEGRLVLDSSGNLYGTTLGGGTANLGTVSKITKTGQETVLYNFCSLADCADGAYPNGGLVLDAAGNLYGTTPYGGDSVACGDLGLRNRI